MKNGTHRARPIAAVFTRTQGDSARLHVFIKFGLSADMNDCLGWQGYFGDNKDKGGKTLTERTMDVLRLCGWSSDDPKNLANITPDHEVEIVVQEDEYRGNVTQKIRFVQEVGTAARFMPQAIPDAEVGSIVNSISRALRGSAPVGGEFPPASDDDIPF
jgi:hypothetical protein